ncbi:MAG: ATP-binding protein [Verrucomicrobiae bacterium]|nr:ATP-binding protein [Verrucomicrobiae bacterium]
MPPSLKFPYTPNSAIRDPARQAAISAAIYIVFCVAYILVSGWIAAAIATSTEDLQRIEAIKGTAFIVVTGLLFFVIIYAHLKRIRASEAQILAQEQSLLRNQRRSIAAMSAASIAHDLNNLLLSLSGLVDELRNHEKPDPFLVTLRKDIEIGIDKVLHLTARVASAARDVLPEERAHTDLASLAGQIIALSRKHPDVKHCSILVPEQACISATINPTLFEEALLNLILNAAQAAGEGGTIEVRITEDNGRAIVEVHDTGPGVPEEIRGRIFDPCFTTKPRGTGVGLLAVKTFVASHGGDVQVGESSWGGALFRLRFPLKPPK